MPHKGQPIFIVGGSSGIGLATACQLAGQGANVAIFARREDVVPSIYLVRGHSLSGQDH